MGSEISKDLFCSGDHYKDGWCLMGDCAHVDSCTRCHRKFPTPEQYQDEYGEKPKVGTAVYNHLPIYGMNDDGWVIGTWAGKLPGTITVIACTPFGKPDDGWRPQ